LANVYLTYVMKRSVITFMVYACDGR